MYINLHLYYIKGFTLQQCDGIGRVGLENISLQLFEHVFLKKKLKAMNILQSILRVWRVSL